MGLQSDVVRALSARQSSAFFELRVSVTNDPGAESYGLPGGRVFVEVLGKRDFAGTQERLWHGSCSRAALITELPDVLRALAHISRTAAADPATATAVALPPRGRAG